MITYANLYHAVEALLPANQPFSIQVTSFKHSVGDVITKWEIYVPFDGGRVIMVDEPTSDAVLVMFQSELANAPATVDETSAAVGAAEVDA